MKAPLFLTGFLVSQDTGWAVYTLCAGCIKKHRNRRDLVPVGAPRFAQSLPHFPRYFQAEITTAFWNLAEYWPDPLRWAEPGLTRRTTGRVIVEGEG